MLQPLAVPHSSPVPFQGRWGGRTSTRTCMWGRPWCDRDRTPTPATSSTRWRATSSAWTAAFPIPDMTSKSQPLGGRWNAPPRPLPAPPAVAAGFESFPAPGCSRPALTVSDRSRSERFSLHRGITCVPPADRCLHLTTPPGFCQFTPFVAWCSWRPLFLKLLR